MKPLNPLNANFTKWSNTLKQFVGKLSMNCLSVFDIFVKLALKELIDFVICAQRIFNKCWMKVNKSIPIFIFYFI